jgi:DMSO reductase iron-sulfur subunit
MSQYYLYQDLSKCIACYSCVIKCKSIKQLPVGPKPSEIITIGPRMIDQRPRAAYVFMPCFHCDNPWCVAVCPTGAMQKRPEDGIVFVDAERCVGCKLCMNACPWGAPQWNPETGKVVKCDFCKDRLDQGLKPACVTVCTTQCLSFGRIDEMPEDIREKFKESIGAKVVEVP